jgi:hypothetical protein
LGVRRKITQDPPDGIRRGTANAYISLIQHQTGQGAVCRGDDLDGQTDTRLLATRGDSAQWPRSKVFVGGDI